jgi:hypothetical protein
LHHGGWYTANRTLNIRVDFTVEQEAAAFAREFGSTLTR